MKRKVMTFWQFRERYNPCRFAVDTAIAQGVRPDTCMDKLWDESWLGGGGYRSDWRLWVIERLEGCAVRQKVELAMDRWTWSSKKAKALRKAWDEAKECSEAGSGSCSKAANAAWAAHREAYLRKYHRPKHWMGV